MKFIYLFVFGVVFASCGKKEDASGSTDLPLKIVPSEDQLKLGKELFDSKGNCAACHQPEQRIIGPSILEIATIYRDENANMVEFLKGNGKPIVDPSQYEIMKTNFAITKKMTNEELKAIEAYMYSHLK